MKKTIGIIVGVFVVISFVAFPLVQMEIPEIKIRNRPPRQQRQQQKPQRYGQEYRLDYSIPQRHPQVVEATTLHNAYVANEIAADRKYRTTLRISGVVQSIGRDIMDEAYVMLVGKIQCMFDPSHEIRLANLNVGDTVTIQGTGTGKTIGTILIRDCTLE